MNEITKMAKKTGRTFQGKTQPAAGVIATVGLIVLSTDEIGADAFTCIMPKAVHTLRDADSLPGR